MKEKRIVITGVGPITSIGIGKKNLWEGILAGKTNIKQEKSLIGAEIWDTFYKHKIENFDIKHFGLNDEDIEYIKGWKKDAEAIDLYYLIAAIKLALNDSALEYALNDNKLSLIVTHENPGLEPLLVGIFKNHFSIIKSKPNISEKEFTDKLYNTCSRAGYEAQTFMLLFHAAKVFNVHRYSLYLNNACASGLYAIEAASELIKSGRSPITIVAASDHPDIYKYIWFKELNMYDKTGVLRPFDRSAGGFVFGDGGSAIVLEDLEHAEKRNAHIYAEYLDGGFSLEGWKVTTPKIGNNSYQNAMLEALIRSKKSKDDIDVICAHGVGNVAIDYYEAKAIVDVFGKKSKDPLIAALKPYIGHNLGGSTLIETIILLLAMENNIVPPVLNTEKIDPHFNINLVREKTVVSINVAMKICCAFAGYNAAVIFKKV